VGRVLVIDEPVNRLSFERNNWLEVHLDFRRPDRSRGICGILIEYIYIYIYIYMPNNLPDMYNFYGVEEETT
jgi:hypothetical protein